MARGLSSIRSRVFCYTAISSAGIVSILPGYLIREFCSVSKVIPIDVDFSDEFLGIGLEEPRMWQYQDDLCPHLYTVHRIWP